MADEKLKVESGNAAGKEFQIGDELLIGRAAPGDGRLEGDTEISRQHARIARGPGGGLTIEDLGSTNGTFVNGSRITGAQPLGHGDTVKVGITTLVVEARSSGQVTAIGGAPGPGRPTEAIPTPEPQPVVEPSPPTPAPSPPTPPPTPPQAPPTEQIPAAGSPPTEQVPAAGAPPTEQVPAAGAPPGGPGPLPGPGPGAPFGGAPPGGPGPGGPPPGAQPGPFGPPGGGPPAAGPPFGGPPPVQAAASGGIKALAIVVGAILLLAGLFFGAVFVIVAADTDETTIVTSTERLIAGFAGIPGALLGIATLPAAIAFAASNKRPSLWWKLAISAVVIMGATFGVLVALES